MKFKRIAKCGLVVLAMSPFGAKAAENGNNSTHSGSQPLTTKVVTTTPKSTVTVSDTANAQNTSFQFVARENAASNAENDNLRQVADSISREDIQNNMVDSTELHADFYERVDSVKSDLLYFIAQFEGVKCRAYADRAARGLPTVGIGYTRRPDGRKVTLRDRINSIEELLQYMNQHQDTQIFPYMEKYLNVDKLNKEQIVALTSLAFNCGAGIFGSKGQPSEFAQNVNKYLETGSQESEAKVREYFMSKVKSGGVVRSGLQKRRETEFLIFVGRSPFKLADFKDMVLGAICSVRRLGLSVDITTMSEYRGDVLKIPGDTLDVSVRKQLRVNKVANNRTNHNGKGKNKGQRKYVNQYTNARSYSR